VLSEAVESQFRGAGFHVFDPEIPERVLDRARADMDARLDLKRSDHPGSRWLNGWTESKAIRSIALAPKVLRLLRQLYGREPLPFQTMNHRIGTELRPHTDSIHFATDPPGYLCGVWVALEDMDEANGPLVYYPYSHKLPVVRTEDFSPETGTRHYPAYEDLIQERIDRSGLEPRLALVRKGLAVIWAANLVHGGSPRRDRSRTRYSQVTHYSFEGCQYYFPLESYGGHRHLLKPRKIG
jgi:ectoine hydroxylase-related dioxygenase (phytanoyl-CoA dioxygenase family)